MVRFVIYILMMFSLNLNAQVGDTLCDLRNIAFHSGEYMKYKVGYALSLMWIKAGQVEFSVKDVELRGREAYHIVGEGGTYSFYEWLFKVDDKYETYIDKETLLPLRFVRKIEEGNYKYFNQVDFDHKNNSCTSLKGTYKVPDCIQDILSAVYVCRNLDFSNVNVNDTVPFNIFLDNQVYPIYVRYLGKETIRTKLGKFRCVKFSPLLIEGTVFEAGEAMKVWVTDDKNKLPLRVESPILFGAVKVELDEYSNLRNKVEAKLK